MADEGERSQVGHVGRTSWLFSRYLQSIGISVWIADITNSEALNLSASVRGSQCFNAILIGSDFIWYLMESTRRENRHGNVSDRESVKQCQPRGTVAKVQSTVSYRRCCY